MSLQSDEFRRLADNAKSRAQVRDRDEICRSVLMSVSDAYAVMARVQDEFDRAMVTYASGRRPA